MPGLLSPRAHSEGGANEAREGRGVAELLATDAAATAAESDADVRGAVEALRASPDLL